MGGPARSTTSSQQRDQSSPGATKKCLVGAGPSRNLFRSSAVTHPAITIVTRSLISSIRESASITEHNTPSLRDKNLSKLKYKHSLKLHPSFRSQPRHHRLAQGFSTHQNAVAWLRIDFLASPDETQKKFTKSDAAVILVCPETSRCIWCRSGRIGSRWRSSW